jgi:hypothetical protein
LRRRLGPVAWMLLEEAALSAEASDSTDSLWSPLSVRRAADSLGIGREAAARALALLVSEGLLRRPGSCRGVAGRFVPGGYWLVEPPGLTATGVDRPSMSREPGLGGPCPVVPVTVVVEGRREKEDRRRGGGRPSQLEPIAVRQTSLFAPGVGEEGAEHVAGRRTPWVVVESVGAVSSVGCEVVDRVHELAPGVRAGADPGVDPHPVKGGDAGC